jgi:hypothetical protein
MKTTVVEIHVDGDKEVRTGIPYDTKWEAELYAKSFNESRGYDFTDKNGKTQRLFFFTIPTKSFERLAQIRDEYMMS